MDSKKLNAYQSESMRKLIDFVNSLGLQQSDIVTILQDRRTEEYLLLYYK